MPDNTVSLSRVMDESFVLAMSTWTVARLVAFMAKTRFTHLVVLRQEGGVRYRYLFSRRDVDNMLARAMPGATLHAAFDLHEYGATPEFDPSADADAVAVDRALVVDADRVAGFVDSREMPLPADAGAPIQRGETRAAAPTDAAQPFTAYPALSVGPAAATEAFDIYAGFRATPDTALGGADAIRVGAPDRGKQCLLVLSGDGVTITPDHAYVSLEPNALVRFSGTFNAGMTTASIKALFIYDQQVIGSARREVSVDGQQPARPVPAAARVNPCRASLPGPAGAVDITVGLNHKRDGTLEWLVLAPGSSRPADNLTFRSSTLPDTKEFAGDLMRDLRALQFRGPFARNVLENVGQQVAALLPPEFFDLLTEVHAALGRTPTVLWLTNEAYVPWELAYLDRPLDAAAPPFLAAQTIMGRWLEDPNVMLPPMPALEVKRLTAVASEYGLTSGQRKLVEAMAEQRTLCDQWGAIPLDATAAEMEAMVTGTKIAGHLVHFAVHGYSDPAANNQSLLLADKSQLPASAMTGAYTCGATPRFSFVFLNACQVGTPGRSLGHAGGFPGVLVRGGTCGFIAPLWDVHDDIARAMAETFYRNTFTEGTSVGAALCAARKGYDNDSTTLLAYIYYGHPALRLSRAN